MLTELRKEGFQPFMVCQTRVRHEDRRDYTKHMLRLRPPARSTVPRRTRSFCSTRTTAAAATRCSRACSFVCHNGLVCGDTFADVRVPHKGSVTDHVIEGAYEVLHGFERVQDSRDAMQVITLDDGEAEVFARSALTLKYDDSDKALPITETRSCGPVVSTTTADLWSVFNRIRRTWSGRPDRPCRQRAPAAHAARPGHRPERPAQPGALAARGWPASAQSLTPSGSYPSRHDPLFLLALCRRRTTFNLVRCSLCGNSLPPRQ